MNHEAFDKPQGSIWIARIKGTGIFKEEVQ
jgi:hypothetical protein